jgi:hypothetical protein
MADHQPRAVEAIATIRHKEISTMNFSNLLHWAIIFLGSSPKVAVNSTWLG